MPHRPPMKTATCNGSNLHRSQSRFIRIPNTQKYPNCRIMRRKLPDFVVVSLNTQSHWVGTSSFAPALNFWLRTADARHVSCLVAQETWLFANESIKYMFGTEYRCAGEKRAPDVAIRRAPGSGLVTVLSPAALWQVAVRSHRCPCPRIQITAVECSPLLFLVNVYGPASNVAGAKEEFRKTFEKAMLALGHAQFVAIGDWNIDPGSLPGRWRDTLRTLGASILTPPCPTYLDRTTPDFCICKTDRAIKCTVSNFDKLRFGWRGSAHGAIAISISGLRRPPPKGPPLTIPRCQRLGRRKVDWESYRRIEVGPVATANVTDMEQAISGHIIKNVTEASTKVKDGRRQQPPMPDVIRAKLFAVANPMENPKLLAEAIKEWAEEHWSRRRAEWEERILSHSSESFRATRNRLDHALAMWFDEDDNCGPPSTLIHEDELESEPAGVANLLVEQFADVSSGREPVWSTLPAQLNNEGLPENLDEIVIRAISRLADSVPGPDGIPVRAYKDAHRTVIQNLCRLVHEALRTGTCPRAWTYAEIAPLLKAGKDPILPVSYRPISLVPVGYRIFGRVIKWLLMDHVKPLLPNSQYGFRPGRQAQMLITALTDLHERPGPRWTVLLDIAKAYDTVPRDLLIRKLIEMRVPTYIVATIQSTLQESWIAVRGGSRWVRTNKGVKQGCVVAPLLFIVFTANWGSMAHDIMSGRTPNPWEPPRNISFTSPDAAMPLIYVDDTAITGAVQEEVERSVETWIDIIHQHELSVNAAKFELIAHEEDEVVQIHDRVIQAGSRVRYLGAFFSSGRSPTKAMVETKSEQCSRLGRLAALSGLTHKSVLAGVSHQALSAFLEPALEYSCESWGTAVGGPRVWATWEGTLTGAGPGGGLPARIQNGRVSLKGRLMITASRWNDGIAKDPLLMDSPLGLVWSNPARNGCVAKLKALAALIPPSTSPRKFVHRHEIDVAHHSRTAASYLEFMNARAKADMQRGLPPKMMNPALRRGDWTLITVFAANMMPSATKQSFKRLIELYTPLNKEATEAVRSVCPLCNANTELQTIANICRPRMSDEGKHAIVMAWAATSARGTASHIIGECPSITRPPSWSALWHAATNYVARRETLESIDHPWMAENRPLHILHALLRRRPKNVTDTLRNIVAQYAQKCEDNLLLIRL